MIQQAIVILLVAACGVWLGWQAYRYMRPKAGGKMCAGGCCDGGEKKPAVAGNAGASRGTMMISSDDIRAAVEGARKA